MHTARARRLNCLPGHACLRARALQLGTALLATLAMAGAQAQAYRNPLVNTATVTAPADVSDPTPGNNSSSDSNALAASAQLSIVKTITTPVPVAAGGAVQYRIEVRNTGPSQAVGATLTDSVPSQLSGVTWTCATVSAATSCSAASGTGSLNVGVNVGVGDVLVVLVNGTAPTVTPATISANAATITPPPGTTDPTPGDNTATTPTIAVQAAAIVANNDDYSAAPFPPGGGGSTPRVFGNDTLAGAAFADAAVVATLTNAPSGYAIAANGIISVPATAAAGPVSLTYQICEAASPSNCASATVSLLVSPDALDDSVAVQAGQAVNGNVASNDNVFTGSTFVQTGAAPSQGSVVLQASGAFTYTANAGATGTDTFGYQVCLPAPNAAVCDTATVTVNLTANTIDAVNDDFSAVPIAAASGGTTASVLGNDTFNGAAVVPANLTTTLITAPAGYLINAAGAVTVPANAVAGPVTLGYRICLTAAPTLCDTASVQLVIAPDAVDDAIATPGAGQPVSANVGSNDNTPAGSTFSLGTAASKGVVTVNSDGSYTYTPNAGVTGSDTFGYQVCLPAPNAAVCDTATVTVTLGANALVANDDLFATPVPGLAGGTTPSVLGNDTLNGVVVTAGAVTATLQAPVAGFSLDANSGVITVAAGTTPGATTLTYQLCEVAAPANCDAASVQVLVAPTAVADSLPVQSGQAVTGSVASNDSTGTGAEFSVLVAPTQGTLVLAADGGFTYTSAAGSSGTDSASYQVCLPAPNSAVCSTATATFVITANTVDAVDDAFGTPAISPVTGGSTPSVLGNDLFNGAAVTAAQVSVSLVNAPPPGYTFTSAGVINVPAGAAAGAQTLTYELCEAGTANCDTAQVALVVAPAATDDSYSTSAGQPLVGDVSLNDNAPATATYSLVTPPAAGTFTLQGNGSFSYAPAAAGPQTAQYQVCLPAPDTAVCATGTVTITVVANTVDAVDDNFRSPVFAPGAGGTTPTVFANDSFNGAPVNPLQVTANLVAAPTGFSIDANGIITVASYAPAGATTLTYSLCEQGGSTCDTAAVQVLIAPDAVDDSGSVTGTQPGTFNLAANDNVPAGATYTVVTPPTLGSAVLSTSGSLQYTANAGASGTDTLTYQVCLPAPDGAVCDTAQVALTLAAAALVAVNDDFSASAVPPSGGSTASVLLNDTFNGAAIVPGTTPVTATLTTLVSGYSMAADGVISVAAGTLPGSVALGYQVCETAAPTNCATATAVVVMSPDAVNDALPAAAGATTVLNVLANDVAPATPVVTISVAPVNGSAVVNADGSISYTPTGSFSGPDSFTYQLCLPAPHGSVCDSATVAVTVSTTSLVAVNDSFLATPIDPAAGGSTTSVLLNDTFSGSAIVPGTTPVTASLVTPVTGYSLSADGVVSVAAGTRPAATTLSYQVCENAVPTNCAAATALVAVSPEAVADSLPATAGTTTVLNVLANDAAPLNPVVTVSAGPSQGTAVANGDGTIIYTPTAGFTGTDTFTYQLCLPAPGGAVCDSATVTVTVSATSLVASNDDFSGTPIAPATGGSTSSVLLNDTFSGAPIVPGTTPVTATLIAAPAGYTISASGVITVAAGTTPAAATLNYQVCENAVPGNCAAATALVAVSPDAVADALPAAAGATTVLNVLANDAAPLNPLVTVSVAAGNGTTLVNGDGTISYTPTAGFTGTDTFSYQVCLPAPAAAVCDTAAVTVTVAATTLTAANDDFSSSPIAPAAGGSTTSVLLNDTFNGVAIVPGTTAVTASLLTTVPGYSMAADGVITVAAGTLPAATTLNYQVCENAVPGNCASASAVVAVSPVAVADTLPATAGTTTVLNVLANDTAPQNPVVTVSVAPTNGTTTVNADGSISYTPTAGYTGADSFTYQLCLPAPAATVCATATVSLTVSNTSLVAANDDFTAAPIAPATGGSTTSVLLNDTFNGVPIVPGTTAVTASLLAPPNGYSMSANGVISVAAGTTPAATTLNYQVCENAAPTNCAAATVVVAVSPEAVSDALPAAAGATTVLNVLANDRAPANPTVTVSVAPTNGSTTVNADGSISYTPTAGFTGTDSFTYQVCLPAPGATVCDSATVTVTVSNTTLSALGDDFTAAPIAPAAGGSTASVLLNDTFNGAAIVPGTTPVSASLVTPVNGYSMNPAGVITVAPGTTPAAVTLNYQVCENAVPTNCAGASAIVAVSPEAVADTLTATAGTTTLLNVLANDIAPLNPVVTVSAAPANGTATVNPDGSINYTPTPGFTGADSFTYQLCLPAPGSAVCDSATVSLTVGANGISALADDFSGTPIAPATGGSTASVLLNDTFNGAAIVPGTTPVSASLVTPVAGYSMSATGVVTVAAGTTPAAVTLNYQVCETAVPTNCAQATALVAVSPDAVADTLLAAAGTSTILNVLANDTAPLNPVLTVTAAPANGLATVLADGTIRYSPSEGFTGSDSFTYRLCLPAPAAGVCDSATVSVTVAATTLVANADDFTAAPIAPASGGTTASVLLNDTFNGAAIVPGTTPVTATLVSPPAGYSMAANGQITVAPGTPPAAATLTYQVCENAVPTNCAQSTAVVAVSPAAANDTLTATAGTTTVLNVTANDTLPSNPTLTVLVAPGNGAAVVNADNTISYTPTGGFTGSDSFTYRVCLPAPAAGVCSTATVTVNVGTTSVSALSDDFSATPIVPAAGGTTTSVLLNDSFNGAPIVPGTTPVTATLITSPTGYSMSPSGVITVAAGLTPVATTLNYQVCENTVPTNCAQATALVAVRPNAADDTLSAGTGTTMLNVAANDTLPLNPVFTVSVAPLNGTAVVNGDNTISYTPNPGFTGTDTFTYQVCLPAPNLNVCDTGSVSVTVSATTLQAVSDNFSGTPTLPGAGGSTPSVLGNDLINGVPVQPVQVTVSLIAPPAGISIDANGIISIAGSAAAGELSLTYQICEATNTGNCAQATALVLVRPDAVNDVATTPAGQALSGSVAGNDNAGGGSVFSLVTAPAQGTVVLNANGSYTYTPNTGFSGSDSFIYQLCLPAPYAGVCDSASLSITVTAAGGALVAVDDAIADVPATGATAVLNVLVNDTFNGAALDPTTVQLTPTNTTAITIQANGSVDVAAGVAGATYTTTYQICLVSQPSVCDIGTVTVTLANPPAGSPVQPADDTATTPQDSPVVVAVLANDLVAGSPVVPASVAVTISTAPTSGTAEVLADGSVRYTPAATFSGSDTFAYTVCTQAAPVQCGTASVTVQVQANAVEVVDETVTTPDGEPVTISLLDNISTSGAPINPRSLRVLAAPRYGRLGCTDGVCIYTAFVGYSGQDAFTYNICDVSIPTPVCADGRVNITVTASGAVLRLTKQAAQRTVKVGELVRYVVTVENLGEVDALGVNVVDTLPAGFTFVQEGFEARDLDNAAFVSARSPLRVERVDIAAGGRATLVYYLRVGAGVGQGIHTNRVTAVDAVNASIGNVASADVEVVGDPLLDESLILGSVFEDRNGNGIQDDGERGIPGVRVASVEGLVMETDAFGRYHLVGINGGQARGRNFILKVDPTTLPADARFTTRNPLLRRITPGLPVRFDFGMQLPDARFDSGRPALRLEFGPALFVPGRAELAPGNEAVLVQAASALQARQGGVLQVRAEAGQEALAADRGRVLQQAVLARLPDGWADRVQVQVLPAPATVDRADR
ncbi:Ig-like domain-containing protein [Stenotrophomonas sp. YAU14D1_LEIMI4_1]|uniref:Ig-like domain-containing protein n=1 Tax=Stenotrophomonas sp. YAU14D1_LEIMI4_1 TaxID=2072407 RepID=UPI000D542915|nr:Ig-like domain-containing protein [Stenotrophomonas sp. YAU14D1_LEIMI4_1]AWH26813.1 hypothetical protein C1932_17730 [Stenotrophomonas sp. YAU14D1_LEIMI4_1]